jgi:23S rRNA (adenine2503-C2)-methyltransferase
MQRPHLMGLFPEELEKILLSAGLPAFRGRQLTQWVFGTKVGEWSQMANIPALVRDRLQQLVQFPTLKLERIEESSDEETTKFLWLLPDEMKVESVLIRAPGRRTVCVSSQVGCPARCAFCASGRFGLVRDLTAGEIAEQVWQIDRRLKEVGESVTNVVYMGMGEPLANYDEVVKSIRLLQHPALMGLSGRRITVSTVGVVEQIPRLANEDLGVSLVLSLHAPNQHLRRKIIPYARQVDLYELLDAIDGFVAQTKRETTYEYILLAGLNDQPEHARELAQLLRHRRGSVNLIPYNPVEGLKLERPTAAAVARFRHILDQEGILHTCRYTKGVDIAAACGQLALQVDPALAQKTPRLVGNQVARQLLGQVQGCGHNLQQPCGSLRMDRTAALSSAD